MKPTKPIWLLVTTEHRNNYSTNVVTFTVRPVYADTPDNCPTGRGDSVRFFTGHYDSDIEISGGLYLEGLALTYYIFPETVEHPYRYYNNGCSEYRDTLNVSLEIAELMVKTLRVIAKRRVKLCDEWGYPTGLGAEVNYLAKCIGAEGIVVEVPDTEIRKGYNRYVDYSWLRNGDVIAKVDNMVCDALALLAKTKEMS
jgi:hypothetical protein